MFRYIISHHYDHNNTNTVRLPNQFKITAADDLLLPGARPSANALISTKLSQRTDYPVMTCIKHQPSATTE